MAIFKYRDKMLWRGLLMKLAIIAGTVGVIAITLPREGSSMFQIEQGKPWRYGDFTAPFDFPIYKSDATVKAERDSMMRLYEPYYNLNDETGGEQVRKFVSAFSNGIPGLSDDYISIIANRLHRLYENGIIATEEYNRLMGDSTSRICIVNGKNASSVEITKTVSTKAAYEQLFLDKALAAHRTELQRCNLNEYITPNLTLDESRSAQSLNDLINSIPLASGVAQKGEKIISRGDIVDEKAYRTLMSFMKENEKRSDDATQIRLTKIGEVTFVAIFITMFTMFLTLFRRDYFEKPRSIAMCYALTILFALLTSLQTSSGIMHVYIIPYAIGPIFIRVFLDSRTAFISHLTTVIICSMMTRIPYEFIIVQSAAGLAAVFSLRELQYRSQVFRSAITITLTAMLATLAYDLMNVSMLSEISLKPYNYLVVSGVLMLFAYPLLYIMEKAFGFISDITLIELSNTNNPLLRKLSEVAPGTFQHSIQVGNLAAEIANKIRANSQLVRTGALYHDIGKMQKPIFFTENQSGFNPHEKLSYIESAQIIMEHVTEGLKMAEEYNLPTLIKDFISTHHGHGKTKYFYVKYKNEHPDEDIDELLFTYPGQNPFTREQAILMMADSIEAASRSLPDYTDETIRNLVDKMIDGMVEEGFFRDCPITFRDISYAKTVIIDKLKTIYHTRVSYPSEKN